MTEDNKKELVSYILSYVAGSNFGDKNSNLQLESHFIDQKTHYIKGMWVVGCVCVFLIIFFNEALSLNKKCHVFVVYISVHKQKSCSST